MTNFSSYDVFFKAATGTDPWPYQKRMGCHQEYPTVLSVPTGAGKTAAVVISWLWRRLFSGDEKLRKQTPMRLIYCLPMRVLVEQTFNVIKEWIEKLDVPFNMNSCKGVIVAKLLGGDKSVYTFSADSSGGSSKSDNENLWSLYPESDAILVGTQDMLLSRALNRGYGASKYRWPKDFALLNNDCLWVMDEIQLMGSGLYTTTQLQAFRDSFGVYGGSHSLWMSATLREEWLRTVNYQTQSMHREELLDDDQKNRLLNSRMKAYKTLRKASSTLDDKNYISSLAKEVLERHCNNMKQKASERSPSESRNTIVVLNTVRRARDLYRKIKEQQGKPDCAVKPEIVLLHSQFRPDDREKALKKALDENVGQFGRIVVSTQVIEAGVDISCSLMFTEIAPWASMVQRYGRVNRWGNLDHSEIYWIGFSDEPADKDLLKIVSPYQIEQIRTSSDICKKFENKQVNPGSLNSCNQQMEVEEGFVIRKKDIVELFDTTADISGFDMDISRFIREAEDFNVHVFWREDSKTVLLKYQNDPARKELCNVPVADIKEILKKKPGTVWKKNYIEGEWQPAGANEIVPGMVLMMNCADGGYLEEIGWSKESKSPVVLPGNPIHLASMDNNASDDLSESNSWKTIQDHTTGVVNKLRYILKMLGYDSSLPEDRLIKSALWHDVGKAHPVFQKSLHNNSSPAPSSNELYAKSPSKRIRHERKGFRHELASALLALQNGAGDLIAYLAASHHGKVRLSIRALPEEDRPGDKQKRFARGVWEGDRIPEAPHSEIRVGNELKILPSDIDLVYMELGRSGKMESWTQRVLGLREEYGPFRLAFMESLIRAADERESGGLI
ncbi:MAG: CRISPR-associated helicase Cas3' [Candidatus Eremiobacteraeota bacterium]|nr:CRISPR-associated helicase Cas3' [Candidatus Eremiobacteraeota bacterium]